MEPQEFVKAVDDAVSEFLSEPKAAPDTPGRENILDDPELAAAAREGFEGNPVAVAYASGYAYGEQAASATLRSLKAWIEGRYADDDRHGHPDAVTDILAEIDARLGR